MGLLSRILDFVKDNRESDKKSRYIFYKIVDSVNEESKLILQCIKTSAFFDSSVATVLKIMLRYAMVGYFLSWHS